jgi:hypothetical protein
MTREEAAGSLEGALACNASGRYSFVCSKALIRVKIRGRTKPMLYRKRDNFSFRIDAQSLIIERLQSFTTKKRLLWENVEYFSAGEPETDNGALFQG